MTIVEVNGVEYCLSLDFDEVILKIKGHLQTDNALLQLEDESIFLLLDITKGLVVRRLE